MLALSCATTHAAPPKRVHMHVRAQRWESVLATQAISILTNSDNTCACRAAHLAVDYLLPLCP